MRKFSTSLIILMVIAVIGSFFALRDVSFYESRYTGYLLQDGKVVPGTDVAVTMDKDRGSFVFTIKHTAEVYHPLALKSLADLNTQVCRDMNGAELKKVGDHHLELRMQQEHDDVVCGKVRIVFTGIDKARMQLNNGAIFELTRIPPTDGMLDGQQKTDFKNQLKKLS